MIRTNHEAPGKRVMLFSPDMVNSITELPTEGDRICSFHTYYEPECNEQVKFRATRIWNMRGKAHKECRFFCKKHIEQFKPYIGGEHLGQEEKAQ